MKVVHVINDLNAGGAEKALHGLLSGGLAEQCANHVISLEDQGTLGGAIRALSVPVTPLHIRAGLSTIPALLKLRRTIRSINCDVIQGWMYHGNLAAILAKVATSNRAVLAWNIRHSLYDLGHEKLLTRQIIRANRMLSSIPNALIYNSQLSREHHEAFGFSSGKSEVIQNGIDVGLFSFCDRSRQKIRAELNIPTNAIVIGHVARFHPMKDHVTFLTAAATIAERHHDALFLLCGRDVTTENPTLSRLIPPTLSPRFRFLGERDDISDLLSAMDVFCMSSWSEAWPTVLGEAMATGLPCVATDAGESASIVGDTGIIVPPQDIPTIVSALDEFLAMPIENRRAFGERARSRIVAHFSLPSVVEQYASCYEKLIAD